MEKTEKNFYTRENGEKIELSSMNTEHILNALNKKQREIFTCQNKDDVSEQLKEIQNLREEYHSRFNRWYDGLKD